MNVMVLPVEQPRTAQRAFVHEADSFVERLSHLVVAMNGELQARQAPSPQGLARGMDIGTIGESWNAAAGVERSSKLNIDGRPDAGWR
jgi:hypothetical protein